MREAGACLGHYICNWNKWHIILHIESKREEHLWPRCCLSRKINAVYTVPFGKRFLVAVEMVLTDTKAVNQYYCWTCRKLIEGRYISGVARRDSPSQQWRGNARSSLCPISASNCSKVYHPQLAHLLYQCMYSGLEK